MTRVTAHLHTFDLRPDGARIGCTHPGCGFSLPVDWPVLRSRSSMDAYTIRKHCTPAALAALGVDINGQPTRSDR
jgi:hypothetical protein